MVGYHAVIGLFEGMITVGVLRYIQRIRPDLVALDPSRAGPRPASPWPLAIQMAIAAAVVGLVLARFASEAPDGSRRRTRTRAGALRRLGGVGGGRSISLPPDEARARRGGALT